MNKDIPLTVTEWEEWGNPFISEEFDYIQTYAPYDNLKAQNYPHMLVKSGLNDPRVGSSFLFLSIFIIFVIYYLNYLLLLIY